MTRWITALLWVGAAAAGCATDNPDQVRLLESDQRALQVRLDGLKRAGERDLRLRDLRQDAAARVEALVDEEIGPFLLLRRGWFQRMLDAVTPLKTSVGGFVWKLARPRVSIENDGVRVKLPFAVMNRRSLRQLQNSRTATNPTGAPAPIPDSAFGVPIIVTDAIVSTEALLTVAST